MSTGEGPREAFFLFEDTTQVLWAEEVAREEGIPVEVVPAPVESEDLCALALRTLPGKVEVLAGFLEEEGIGFRTHP
jgi:hypothetical protein